MRLKLRRPTPLQTLLLAGLAIVLAGSVVAAYVAGAVVEARLLALDARQLAGHIRVQSSKHLTPASFAGRGDGDVARFGADLMLVPDVVRVKIYDSGGRILWSNEPKLIGKLFPDNASLARALRGETVVGAVKTTRTEHEYERSLGRVREIYLPVAPAGRAPVGVVELYLDAAPMEREVRNAQMILVGVSVVIAVILYGLLSVAVWRASMALARARARETAGIEARLRLVERLRAFGEVAAGATHDLANVFAVIQGRVQLLLRARDVLPGVATSLGAVEKSVADGIEIARRLRQIGRSDDRSDFESVDVSIVARDVIKITEPRWRACRGVEVVPALEDVPPVQGRPSELREVLTNLVLNALDAMPDGGRLTVSSSCRNGHVRVAVTDTGAGMDEGVRQKLFTPFFTTKSNGTGLGLSVSYGIVKRHGGSIDVESEPGKGTSFVVSLPSAASRATAGSPP